MPVTLADVRARVLDDLKRNDATRSIGSSADYTRLDRWIRDSIRRIQQTLNSPIDDAISAATIEEGFSGAITVPGNLISLESIQVDGVELTMRSSTEVKAAQKIGTTAQSRYFVREAGRYLIAPLPPVGAVVTIHYHADFDNPVAPTDSLKLFDMADDLVALGAMIAAAGWSMDDKRLITWNSMFNTRFAELQELANRMTLTNASVRPAYNINGDGEW